MPWQNMYHHKKPLAPDDEVKSEDIFASPAAEVLSHQCSFLSVKRCKFLSVTETVCNTMTVPIWHKDSFWQHAKIPQSSDYSRRYAVDWSEQMLHAAETGANCWEKNRYSRFLLVINVEILESAELIRLLDCRLTPKSSFKIDEIGQYLQLFECLPLFLFLQ